MSLFPGNRMRRASLSVRRSSLKSLNSEDVLWQGWLLRRSRANNHRETFERRYATCMVCYLYGHCMGSDSERSYSTRAHVTRRCSWRRRPPTPYHPTNATRTMLLVPASHTSPATTPRRDDATTRCCDDAMTGWCGDRYTFLCNSDVVYLKMPPRPSEHAEDMYDLPPGRSAGVYTSWGRHHLTIPPLLHFCPDTPPPQTPPHQRTTAFLSNSLPRSLTFLPFSLPPSRPALPHQPSFANLPSLTFLHQTFQWPTSRNSTLRLRCD